MNILESKELCGHLADTLYNLKLAKIMDDESADVRESKFMVQFKREWEVFSASYEGRYFVLVLLVRASKHTCIFSRSKPLSYLVPFFTLINNCPGTPRKGPAAEEVLSTFYYTRFLECFELQSVKLKDSFAKDIRKLQVETRDLAAALSIITTERNVLHTQHAEVEGKLAETESKLRNSASRMKQMEAAMQDLIEKVYPSQFNNTLLFRIYCTGD